MGYTIDVPAGSEPSVIAAALSSQSTGAATNNIQRQLFALGLEYEVSVTKESAATIVTTTTTKGLSVASPCGTTECDFDVDVNSQAWATSSIYFPAWAMLWMYSACL